MSEKEHDAYFRITQLRDNLGRTRVEIQALDPEMVALFVRIALEEYEKVGYAHGRFEEQFIGILGEYVVKKALDHLGIPYHYYERTREHWRKGEKRSPDFKIEPNGPLLEICTTPPSRRYVCCTVKENKLDFEWDYVIGVKIERIKYEAPVPYKNEWQWVLIDGDGYPNKLFEIIKNPSKQITPSTTPIGEAMIYGYGIRKEIENKTNGWKRAENTNPCPYYPCIWKRLEDLRKDSPIMELWKLIREETNKWK